VSERQRETKRSTRVQSLQERERGCVEREREILCFRVFGERFHFQTLLLICRYLFMFICMCVYVCVCMCVCVCVCPREYVCCVCSQRMSTLSQ